MRSPWLAALAVLLASCAAAPEQPAPGVTEGLPLQIYRDALGSAPVYRVDAEASRIDVIVRRDGQLRRFGHDHVVTARGIDGYLMQANAAGAGSRADLRVDLTRVAVDESPARTVYGLETEPTADDIAGTAENLHDKVLETRSWPEARIAVSVLEQAADSAQCEVQLNLKGVERTFPVEVLIDSDGDILRARGMFDIRQSDFGIEPFSLLGGALAVRDRLEIAFWIGARRVDHIGAETGQ
jgi:polyisoprenoid-binding protein YceI